MGKNSAPAEPEKVVRESSDTQSKPKKAVKGLGGKGLKASKSKVQTITLPDGTQMPVGIPPGMDPAFAQEVIAYLKKDPETAKKSLEAAQMLMTNPAMAVQMTESQDRLRTGGPELTEKLQKLKDDPDLKHVFEDIIADQRNMEKYWNDTELMSKISAKLDSMQIGPAAAARQMNRPKILTLHDAAKLGDVAALKSMLEGGIDVNAEDGRGVTALGVAVGFNRLPAVKALLEAGADVHKRDLKGNTVLFYAAGYGRKEAAQLLVEAGADPGAVNQDGQRPIDAARINRESHLVAYLDSLEADPAAKFL